MNVAGKEHQRILEHIRKTLSVKKSPPVILKWRQDLTDSGQEGVEAQEKESFIKQAAEAVSLSDKANAGRNKDQHPEEAKKRSFGRKRPQRVPE
jgi:hypothetical protein